MTSASGGCRLSTAVTVYTFTPPCLEAIHAVQESAGTSAAGIKVAPNNWLFSGAYYDVVTGPGPDPLGKNIQQ